MFDEDGRHRTDYVEGQDIMAWVTQGAITDRTVEHLGRSDVGVTMLRRMFKAEMSKVEAGEDPLGTIREPHDRIDLPCEKNKFDAGPQFALDFIDMASSRFSPQVGRPQEAAHHRLGEPAEGMTLVDREIDPAFGLDVGRGWFPADAESHRRDAPKFCPSCAAPLGARAGRSRSGHRVLGRRRPGLRLLLRGLRLERRHRADRAGRRPRGGGVAAGRSARAAVTAQPVSTGPRWASTHSPAWDSQLRKAAATPSRLYAGTSSTNWVR